MTKAEKEYLNRVAELGCIICESPAEIHHKSRGAGMGRKSSNYETIPLCHVHHRTGGYGVAIHEGLETFESIFGTEDELIQKVQKMLY